jgi:putative transposase
MPKRFIRGSGGHIFHVTNRAALGQVLFDSPDSYLLFLHTLKQACEHVPMRVLAYCLMPNHWHLVLAPIRDGDLSRFMHWLTGTHAKRLRHATNTVGRGAVYQGPYHADPVDNEAGLYRLLRYVERNPVRARLIERAEGWPWSSATLNPVTRIPLTPWPVPRPKEWLELLAAADVPYEVDAIRLRIVYRSKPPDETREGAVPSRPAWFRPASGSDDTSVVTGVAGESPS